MIISRNLAHVVKEGRKKDLILGSLALLSLVVVCIDFVKGKNSFYQLVFLAELIFVNYEMVIVFVKEYQNLCDQEYVLNMGYLIKEVNQATNSNREPSLEEMIQQLTRFEISWCRHSYTATKMAFHNFCCESVDFIYFVAIIGVILQGLFFKQFHLNNIYLFLLPLIVALHDSLFLAVSIIIEMPRRIRQYVQIKLLERRVVQLQNKLIQITDQLLVEQHMDDASKEVQLLVQGIREEATQFDVQQNPQNERDLMICGICQEAMNIQADLQGLTCHPSHIFHRDCIESWLNQCSRLNRQGTCPICRKVVIRN